MFVAKNKEHFIAFWTCSSQKNSMRSISHFLLQTKPLLRSATMEGSFHGLQTALVQLTAPCLMRLLPQETCPGTIARKDVYQLISLRPAASTFFFVTSSPVGKGVPLMDRCLMMHEGVIFLFHLENSILAMPVFHYVMGLLYHCSDMIRR